MQDILNHLNPWLVGLLSLLGTLVTVASAASAVVPKGTALGEWLAWFATMPIKHRPQKALPKIDPPSAGVALALIAFAALQLCQACSASPRQAQQTAEDVRLSYDAACRIALTADPEFAARLLGMTAEQIEGMRTACRIGLPIVDAAGQDGAAGASGATP